MDKKCTADCDERVGAVCMKYAKTILRHDNSNQYEVVGFAETGVKCPECIKETETETENEKSK